MKILLDVKEEKAAFVMELLNNLKFVKIEKLDDEKEEVLKDLKQAIEEVKLHKEGKIQLKSAKDLLNEL